MKTAEIEATYNGFEYNNTPQFGMMIYVIDYKSGFNGRYACGNYYPIYDEVLIPHFFQGSICW